MEYDGLAMLESAKENQINVLKLAIRSIYNFLMKYSTNKNFDDDLINLQGQKSN